MTVSRNGIDDDDGDTASCGNEKVSLSIKSLSVMDEKSRR